MKTTLIVLLTTLLCWGQVHSQTLPDLEVTNLSLNPSGVLVGNSVSISFQHRNLGGSTGGVNCKIYLSDFPVLMNQWITLSSFTVYPSSSTQTHSQSYTIPTSWTHGTGYIIVSMNEGSCYSGSGGPQESNCYNNRDAEVLIIGGPNPDYTLTGSSLSTTTLEAGEQFEFDGFADNVGADNAIANSTVGWYYSKNSTLNTSTDQLLTTYSLSPLGSGSSRNIGINRYMNLPSNVSTGTGYIIVKTDIYNSVSETNENNNLAVLPITVTGPPDFEVFDLSVNPTGLYPGDNFSVNWKYRNRGYPWGSGVNCKVYLSDFPVLLNHYQEIDNFTVYPASYARTVYKTYTTPTNWPSWAAGAYLIVSINNDVCYGTSTVPADNNCYNNRVNEQLFIGGPNADYHLTGSSLSSTTPSPGDQIEYDGFCANTGTDDAVKYSRVGWYYSQDQTLNTSTDVLLKTHTISPLNSGASTNVGINRNLTIPASATVGSGYILVKADLDNVIQESNENNNLTALPITVQAPPGNLEYTYGATYRYDTDLHCHAAWPSDVRANWGNTSPFKNWNAMNSQVLANDLSARNVNLVAWGGVDWEMEKGKEGWVSSFHTDSKDFLNRLAPGTSVIAQLKFVPKVLVNDSISPWNRKTLAIIGRDETEAGVSQNGFAGPRDHYRIRLPDMFNITNTVYPDRQDLYQDVSVTNWWDTWDDNPITFGPDPQPGTFQHFVRQQFDAYATEVASDSRVAYLMLGNEPNGNWNPRIFARLLCHLNSISQKPIVLANFDFWILTQGTVWLNAFEDELENIYGSSAAMAASPPPFDAVSWDPYPKIFTGFQMIPGGTVASNDPIFRQKIDAIYNRFQTTQPLKYMVKELGFEAWSQADKDILLAPNGSLPDVYKEEHRRLISTYWNLGYEELVWFNQFTSSSHHELSVIQTDGSLVENALGGYLRKLNNENPTRVVDIDMQNTTATTTTLTAKFLNTEGFGFRSGNYRILWINNSNQSEHLIQAGAVNNLEDSITINLTVNLPAACNYSFRVDFDPDLSNFQNVYRATVHDPALVSCSLGEDSKRSQSVELAPFAMVYPNPAGTRATVQLSGQEMGTKWNFTLINSIGKTVQSTTHVAEQAGTMAIPLDLSHLPSGVYLIKCTNDQGVPEQILRLVKSQ